MPGLLSRLPLMLRGRNRAPILDRPPERTSPARMTRRTLVIVQDPLLPQYGGKTLREHWGWNDPDALAQEFIADVRAISHGIVDYEIAERANSDVFPRKVDGFRYDSGSYLSAQLRGGFHEPDQIDYMALVREYQLLERVRSGSIDEVWLFGFPYAGYFESIMAGPGAFWCNAPPLGGTDAAGRRFVIMGFNVERGVGEMLEDLGHRAEAILSRVFEGERGDANLFARFTRYDRRQPDRAECGNVHFAPNSQRDYDWGNPRPVLCRCDNWLRFPDLSGPPRIMYCSEWGNGDIREHHRWWFSHFPHWAGQTNGISWNWWDYVIDPNLVNG